MMMVTGRVPTGNLDQDSNDISGWNNCVIESKYHICRICIKNLSVEYVIR